MDKIIGLDLDGVIVDHSGLKIELAGAKGVELTREQTPSEIMKDLFPLTIWRGIMHELYGNLEVSLKAPLMAGAEDGLRTIKENGEKYYLITRRRSMEMIKAVLSAKGLWGSYFDENNVCMAATPEDKDTESKVRGITHFADDEQKILRVLGSVENKVLFDPYKVFTDGEFKTVSSWPELIELWNLKS